MARTSKARTPVTGSVTDAIEFFYTTASELAEEIREAYDNTPESLQGSGVGEARGEAADTLEGFCENQPELELSEELSAVVSWTENRLRKASRADRMSSGIAACEGAISAIEDAISSLKEKISEVDMGDAQEGHDQGEDEKAEYDSWVSDKEALEEALETLQSDMSDAEGVEFPGMYG